MSSSSSDLPAPITTELSGSSAKEHRQARLLAKQRIKALQERAAAGEHDATVGDVARELGGRALGERGEFECRARGCGKRYSFEEPWTPGDARQKIRDPRVDLDQD